MKKLYLLLLCSAIFLGGCSLPKIRIELPGKSVETTSETTNVSVENSVAETTTSEVTADTVPSITTTAMTTAATETTTTATTTVATTIATPPKRELLSDYELSLIRQLIRVRTHGNFADYIAAVGAMIAPNYLLMSEPKENHIDYQKEEVYENNKHYSSIAYVISENEMREAVKHLFGAEIKEHVDLIGWKYNMYAIEDTKDKNAYYRYSYNGSGDPIDIIVDSYEIVDDICTVNYRYIEYNHRYEKKVKKEAPGTAQFLRTGSSKYPWQYISNYYARSDKFPDMLYTGLWVQYDTDHQVAHSFTFTPESYSQIQLNVHLDYFRVSDASSGKISIDKNAGAIHIGDFSVWQYNADEGSLTFGDNSSNKIYRYNSMPSIAEFERDMEELYYSQISHWQKVQEEEKKKQESMSKEIDLSELLCEGYWCEYAVQFYGGDMYRFYPDGTCEHFLVNLEGKGGIDKYTEKETYTIDPETLLVAPGFNSWYYNADEGYMYNTIGSTHSGTTATMRIFHYNELPSIEQMREDEANMWLN